MQALRGNCLSPGSLLLTRSTFWRYAGARQSNLFINLLGGIKMVNLGDIPELTDRDQLVLAAAAVGYRIKNWENDVPTIIDQDGNERVWRPHQDDGDSRRLQVELAINILFNYDQNLIAVESPQCGVNRLNVNLVDEAEGGQDPYALSRSLTLLCAAAIAGDSFKQGIELNDDEL